MENAMYYLSSQLVVTNKLGVEHHLQLVLLMVPLFKKTLVETVHENMSSETLNDVTELDTKYATGNIQLHKLLTILLLMSCRNESARQKQTKNQWIVGVNKVFYFHHCSLRVHTIVLCPDVFNPLPSFAFGKGILHAPHVRSGREGWGWEEDEQICSLFLFFSSYSVSFLVG